MARKRPRHATAASLKTRHHAQARISEEARIALATLADERGVSESEIVRDILEAALFGAAPGATITGPDQGYRIAKSTANVIARKMLHAAMTAIPDEWMQFKKLLAEGKLP